MADLNIAEHILLRAYKMSQLANDPIKPVVAMSPETLKHVDWILRAAQAYTDGDWQNTGARIVAKHRHQPKIEPTR